MIDPGAGFLHASYTYFPTQSFKNVTFFFVNYSITGTNGFKESF